MVSWTDDGYMSGYVLEDTDTANWSASGYLLASPGTVDVQAITRLQYPVTLPAGTDPFQPDRVRTVAPLTFTSGDVTVADGRLMVATMFFAPASDFGAGVVPTPAAIIAAPNLRVFRSTASRTTAGSSTFNIPGPLPASLQPNKKYWVLTAPTFADSGSLPSRANDTPVGNVNVLGRALSMWTNRTPPAPTITTPTADLIVPAGTVINLEFDNNDPDRLPWDTRGGTSPVKPERHEDIAGLQFQYSERPTAANPNPPWFNLPVSEYAPDGVTPAMRPGWTIEYATSPDSSSTVATSKVTKSLTIQCGVDVITRQRGVLPSGNWRLRMRSFDYGHPFTRLNGFPGYGPLGVVATGSYAGSTPATGGNPAYNTSYTPDTYPAVNTSPWSTVVNLTITEQIPAPVPISPINAIAIPQGTPITLSYQYRNTYAPPFAQASRTIQVRKVGSNRWIDVVSGNTADTTYVLPSVLPNEVNDDCNSTEGWSSIGGSGGPATVVDGRIRQTANGNAPQTYLRREGGGPAGTRVLTSGRRKGPGPTSGTRSIEVEFWTDAGVRVAATPLVLTNTGTADAADFVNWVATYDVTEDFDHIRVRYYYDNFAVPAPILEVDQVVVIQPVVALDPTAQYQWRVQATDTSGKRSAYSAPASFWIVPAPASGVTRPVPSGTIEGATLGCGTYHVQVFRRGGKRFVGELTQITDGDWSRVRDDISDAKVVIQGWDLDCGKLLAKLQTWAYEVVIFRNNGFTKDRVWEGPITLLTYEKHQVTIHAKDVMAYAYRRIIKQAMNDTGSSPTAGRSVVARAVQVIQNAFAPSDPNVLAYLTVVANTDDAKQYRALPPYSRTAFEEVDDMAANAGLDYTAAGRSIIVWGTKHRIGTLPEFRDADLGQSPIVSEYGMSFANFYAISDGNGVHGEADRLDEFGQDETYGNVEMLSSTWASESAEETGTYTEEGIATLSASFAEHAERSIADRYPPPVVVRVPDNTTLNPSTVLSIQQLIPGVVVPLRSTSTLRDVVANQKLDSVKVQWTSSGENIAITLSPFNRDDTDLGETE